MLNSTLHNTYNSSSRILQRKQVQEITRKKKKSKYTSHAASWRMERQGPADVKNYEGKKREAVDGVSVFRAVIKSLQTSNKYWTIASRGNNG